jgi:hypothetical protein
MTEPRQAGSAVTSTESLSLAGRESKLLACLERFLSNSLESLFFGLSVRDH